MLVGRTRLVVNRDGLARFARDGTIRGLSSWTVNKQAFGQDALLSHIASPSGWVNMLGNHAHFAVRPTRVRWRIEIRTALDSNLLCHSSIRLYAR